MAIKDDDHGPMTDALWQCWKLLNAQRAAVGPTTYRCSEEYFDLVVENAAEQLGDFCKPWHPNHVRRKRKETDES